MRETTSVILTRRCFFMGIAMLMILAFHLSRGYGIFLFKSIFSRGFYGVDIFLFFSALGCSYSYSRNKLSVFYANRAKRVLPLFYVLVCFRLSWAFYSQSELDAVDVLMTISGISYLKLFGGYWIDWYLCALLLLYAAFPIYFKYIKRYGWGGYLIVSLFSSLISLLMPLPWEHSCLVGRLSIFALGVIFYLKIVNMGNSDAAITKAVVAYGILLFIIDVIYPNNRTRFLAPAFLTPLLIWLVSKLFLLIENRSYRLVALIEFFGKHSLEIYVANCMSMVICQQGFGLQGYAGVTIEIGIIGVLSVLLYYVNRFLTHCLR